MVSIYVDIPSVMDREALHVELDLKKEFDTLARRISEPLVYESEMERFKKYLALVKKENQTISKGELAAKELLQQNTPETKIMALIALGWAFGYVTSVEEDKKFLNEITLEAFQLAALGDISESMPNVAWIFSQLSVNK